MFEYVQKHCEKFYRKWNIKVIFKNEKFELKLMFGDKQCLKKIFECNLKTFLLISFFNLADISISI